MDAAIMTNILINNIILINPNFECFMPACFSSLYFLKLKYSIIMAAGKITQLYFVGFTAVGNILRNRKEEANWRPLSVADLVCIVGFVLANIKKTTRLNEWFPIIID